MLAKEVAGCAADPEKPLLIWQCVWAGGHCPAETAAGWGCCCKTGTRKSWSISPWCRQLVSFPPRTVTSAMGMQACSISLDMHASIQHASIPASARFRQPQHGGTDNSVLHTLIFLYFETTGLKLQETEPTLKCSMS